MNSCMCNDVSMLGDDIEFDKKIALETLQQLTSGRTISYGVGGDPEGSPVLFFPALSGTRRMLLAIQEHLLKHSLQGICVNRPGTGGSSPSKGIQDHVEKACDDVVAVLDELQIERVGILCMCAGTNFALAFCTRYPNRTSGKLLALAPWVLPADCPYSKGLDRFAARNLPVIPVGFLVGTMEKFVLGCFSKETIAKKIRTKSSRKERNYLDETYSESTERSFEFELNWMLGQVERNTYDVAVCLSDSKALGIDYKAVPLKIMICQGDRDHMAPVPAAEWLNQQFHDSTLTVFPNGTHAGALFVLGPQFADSLAFLRP